MHFNCAIAVFSACVYNSYALLHRFCPWKIKGQYYCGTDGQTYDSLCSINMAMYTNRQLEIDYRGPCRKFTNTDNSKLYGTENIRSDNINTIVNSNVINIDQGESSKQSIGSIDIYNVNEIYEEGSKKNRSRDGNRIRDISIVNIHSNTSNYPAVNFFGEYSNQYTPGYYKRGHIIKHMNTVYHPFNRFKPSINGGYHI